MRSWFLQTQLFIVQSHGCRVWVIEHSTTSTITSPHTIRQHVTSHTCILIGASHRDMIIVHCGIQEVRVKQGMRHCSDKWVALPVALPVSLPFFLPVSLPVALPVALTVALPVALSVALPVALPGVWLSLAWRGRNNNIIPHSVKSKYMIWLVSFLGHLPLYFLDHIRDLVPLNCPEKRGSSKVMQLGKWSRRWPGNKIMIWYKPTM